MENKNRVKRRHFLKTAVAAGTATGIAVGTAKAKKKGSYRFDLNRDFIRVGMVGLGPYSHAMMYTEPINDPNFPPRTNMRVVAIWQREDGYRNFYRVSPDEQEKKVKGLHDYMSIDKFTNYLDVKHVVKYSEDMLELVDAVFITDPDDALNLARPFLEAGMPVFLNRPNAWNMYEIREIVRLAKENDAPLVTGSCVPWMQEVQVVAGRIKSEKVQQYYLEGSGANFCSYYAHILETALKLVPGKVKRVWTFGPKVEPDVDPPGTITVAHLEYEKITEDRDPILGVVTNFFEKPIRCWAKIHIDSDLWLDKPNAVEMKVYWEPVVGDRAHDEHIVFPFMRVIEHTFMTGEWPEDGEHIINKVATMLMTHKSLVEGGRPVSRDEIENHSLPRYKI